MSDAERDQIDSEAEKCIKGCSDAIKAAKTKGIIVLYINLL